MRSFISIAFLKIVVVISSSTQAQKMWIMREYKGIKNDASDACNTFEERNAIAITSNTVGQKLES